MRKSRILDFFCVSGLFFSALWFYAKNAFEIALVLIVFMFLVSIIIGKRNAVKKGKYEQ